MKALLRIAAALALCSCAAQTDTGAGGDDGSTGGGGGGTGGGGTGGGGGAGGGNIAPGLQPAIGLASSTDPDVKTIGEACVTAEADWQKNCGCPLHINFDLTKPSYTHNPPGDDQRFGIEFMCEDISNYIMQACNTRAAAMCTMSTLDIRRIDADALNFTVTAGTGNAQMNWDGFETDMYAIVSVVTGTHL